MVGNTHQLPNYTAPSSRFSSTIWLASWRGLCSLCALTSCTSRSALASTGGVWCTLLANNAKATTAPTAVKNNSDAVDPTAIPTIAPGDSPSSLQLDMLQMLDSSVNTSTKLEGTQSCALKFDPVWTVSRISRIRFVSSSFSP